MKSLVLRVFIVLTIIIAMSSLAFADASFTMIHKTWDYYYYTFRIKGYPTFNTLYNRYDFYDIAGTYRGSLTYNNLLEDWEFFGI